MVSRLVLLSSVCVAATAWAGGEKPIVDDASHYVDESTVFFKANTGGDGYWVQAGGEMAGGENEDSVYLEVKQGGKLLSTVPCRFGGGRSQNFGLDTVKCGEASQKALKASGALQADLILRSDKDDKLYLLRTFKVNVKKWDNKDWQIEADDLLAAGYVALRTHSGDPSPEFRFWLANGNLDGAVTTRCKVNGKAMPELTTSLTDDADLGVDIIKGDKRTTWHWTHYFATPDENGLSAKKRDGAFSFAENPGTWDCELRHSGVILRELIFTVGKDGKLVPPSMQTAKGAPKLGPDVVQADMRIGKGNGVDKRIKPDVLKKSRGFGLAWTQDDGLKTMLAALPAAYENQNPTVKKEKGKLLIGAEQNPPKTIDHSLAWLHLRSRANGYVFSSYQEIVGVTPSPSDRYRLEWKQGGKLLATGKCGWGDDFLECEYDDKPLTAKGAIEASLIFGSDSDPNEYVLNTYKVNVAKYPSYGDPVWQIVPDDLLATAWVFQPSNPDQHVAFRFWIAATQTFSPKLRCTVDGKKKVPDIDLGNHSGDGEIVAETHQRNGADKKYIWHNVNGTTTVRAGLPPKNFSPNGDTLDYLGQFPGQWECDARNEGKVFRKLLFKVNDKGLVEADPAQAGAASHPDVVPIDLRFGKDIIDTRVRPDAMKKSRGFGLPWPKAPTKPFPPASGLPDPK